MDVHYWKKSGNRWKIENVSLDDVFWLQGYLCIRCEDVENGMIKVKAIHCSFHTLLQPDIWVELEHDAEIHIGPHPAEAKLKRLIARCEVVFDALAKHGTPCPAIPAMIKEFEDDDDEEKR